MYNSTPVGHQGESGIFSQSPGVTCIPQFVYRGTLILLSGDTGTRFCHQAESACFCQFIFDNELI